MTNTPQGRRSLGARLRRLPPVPVIATLLVVAVTLAFALLIGLNPLYLVAVWLLVAVGVVAVRRWWGRRSAGAVGDHPTRTFLVQLALVAVIVFGLIQAVPYGRAHSNPPVTGEPQWNDPATRALVVRACYGCHSNEVEWPWYSNVAPISWAITDHVDEGRDAVNFSEFDRHEGEAENSADIVREGEMPPGYYTAFGRHPEADLSDAEVAQLIAGLEATPGLSEGGD